MADQKAMIQFVSVFIHMTHPTAERREFEPDLGLNLTFPRAEAHLCSEQRVGVFSISIATFIAAVVNPQLTVKRPVASSGRLGDFKYKECQPFSASASQRVCYICLQTTWTKIS